MMDPFGLLSMSMEVQVALGMEKSCSGKDTQVLYDELYSHLWKRVRYADAQCSGAPSLQCVRVLRSCRFSGVPRIPRISPHWCMGSLSQIYCPSLLASVYIRQGERRPGFWILHSADIEHYTGTLRHHGPTQDDKK